MNWKRGLLRLSIFATAIWIAGISRSEESRPASAAIETESASLAEHVRESRVRRTLRWLRSINNWTLIASLVLAAATVILAGATYWLASDAHQQLSVMGGQLNEMRAERRPWIEVDAYIGGVTWDAQGGHIALRYEIKNTGRSPALHVLLRDKIVPFLSPDPHSAPFVLLKQMSREQRNRGAHLGYPVLPGQTISSQLTKDYSREELEKYQRDIGKAYATNSSDDAFLQLTLGYVVDYTFDVGTEHHQTYCLLMINYVDPKAPLGPGKELTIGKDLPASSVRLDSLPLYCDAD